MNGKQALFRVLRHSEPARPRVENVRISVGGLEGAYEVFEFLPDAGVLEPLASMTAHDLAAFGLDMAPRHRGAGRLFLLEATDNLEHD